MAANVLRLSGYVLLGLLAGELSLSKPYAGNGGDTLIVEEESGLFRRAPHFSHDPEFGTRAGRRFDVEHMIFQELREVSRLDFPANQRRASYIRCER
jgi:hypothetical protein